MSKKKKKIMKVIGSSIAAILLLAICLSIYAYNQLQPENHFKSVPVLNSASKNSNDGSTETRKVKEPSFNVLLIGSDERKGQDIGHSDSMMIVNVNLATHEYHILSIPRDSRVFLQDYGYTKLTSIQYILQANKGSKQGIEEAVKAIGAFTGIMINYYVETNYLGLQAMVDALGGIDMNVPFDVKLTHPWYPENANKVISAGNHFLNGKMVTELAHERYSLKNGEYSRQQLQQEVLKGIAKESLNPGNISKLPKLANSISEFLIASNMSKSDMISLGLAVKGFNSATQVHYHQLQGEEKMVYDDILKANNAQIMINKKKMKEIADQYFIQ